MLIFSYLSREDILEHSRSISIALAAALLAVNLLIEPNLISLA